MIDHHRMVDDSFGPFHSTHELQHVHSCTSNAMNELNLSVVNKAFGEHSDLYLHVLRVKPNAGSAQIQEAYFERRNELFQLLSQMNPTQNEYDDKVADDDQQKQYNTERKMDAVVCAVRILGDPDLRLQYDDIRTERIRWHTHQQRNAGGHGAASPYSATSGSTVTHKNRNNNGAVSPSLSLPLSLPLSEAVPDMMSSTATVSTADNNNDQTNMSTNTTFLDYFSVQESMNASSYFETTINSYYSTEPAVTAATMAVKGNSDDENILRPLSLNASKDSLSKMLTVNENDDEDDEHIPNLITQCGDTKPNPSLLMMSRRRVNQPRSPARAFEPSAPKPPLMQKRLPFSSTTPTLQTPQTLQRRVTTNETITTYGDGSMEQLSNDSTMYYDDDEEETYYTIDDYEEYDDEDEDDSFEPRRSRSRTTRKNRGKNRGNSLMFPISLSCLDHGIDRIRGEMLDAIDDATNAFEQVLNVFTIQEEDILAVRSRIEKAKRQVANTHIVYPHSSKNSEGRNNPEHLCGDDDEESSNNHKRRKSKQFVLPPPPSSLSARRNRKVKS